MTPAGAAVAAETAGDMAFAGHPVTDFETSYLDPHVDDLATVFVADGHRHGNRCLGPVIPFEDMDIGATDRRSIYLYQNVVMTDLRHRDVLHPDAALGFRLDQCFHRYRSKNCVY